MGHPTKRRHGSDREIQGLELCTWDIPQRGDMDLTERFKDWSCARGTSHKEETWI